MLLSDFWAYCGDPYGDPLSEKQVQPTNLSNLASFIHHMLLSLFYKILPYKIQLEQSTPQMKIQ